MGVAHSLRALSQGVGADTAPKPAEAGAPSITVSALSRDTSSEPVTILLPWSPTAGFAFPFVEGFGVAFVFCSFRPRPAFRIARWKTGSTNHLSGHFTSDHDSLFELPDFLGEARRPIRPTMSYWPTRVPLGLPCMRTSCAYPAWLRSIQYIRTANFLAMATFATPLPRRSFNRW